MRHIAWVPSTNLLRSELQGSGLELMGEVASHVEAAFQSLEQPIAAVGVNVGNIGGLPYFKAADTQLRCHVTSRTTGDEPQFVSLARALGYDLSAWVAAPTQLVDRDREQAARFLADVDPRSVVVFADGSCARTQKSPNGYLEDAEQLDAALYAAIASGDPGHDGWKITDDVAQAHGLAGLGAMHVGTDWWKRTVCAVAEAQVTWHGCPFGVTYMVATWHVTPSDKPHRSRVAT